MVVKYAFDLILNSFFSSYLILKQLLVTCCSTTSSSRWRPYSGRATRTRDYVLTEDLLCVSRGRNS